MAAVLQLEAASAVDEIEGFWSTCVIGAVQIDSTAASILVIKEVVDAATMDGMPCGC